MAKADTIRLAGGAVLRHGQIINSTPGARPNSAPKDSPYRRASAKPKNFQLADREVGCNAHDIEIGVIGASHGMNHHPDGSHSRVEIHPGMHFREGGKFNAGISRTQANSPTDDEKNSKLLFRDAAADKAQLDRAKLDRTTGEYRKYPGVEQLRGRLPDKLIKG